ncbi:hypothetical protein [Vibrio cholerae]|uniref:hypothetical protein n=1 Tax=Vibrio cholerae TaxID=666 RepID=UPI00115B2E7B|nr:hypothetical protein [Vibrio cholerae]EGR2027043.1 hypothetical protein [Vibrio cholerae]TQP46495.1 hypothetical protein FLL90_14265 [Vibrio cholerae]TQP83145.1 hypothetical protein FLL89_10740 [Vibrio cholerae]
MEVFGSLATIVGLMCNFKSERRASSDDEYKEFVEWLDTKRHKSIVEELNSNHLLGLSIKSLLNQNHEVVVQKLSDLDGSLIRLASQIDGLKEVANAIAPNVDLSDQAISVIQQLVDSQGSYFIEIKLHGGTLYQVMDGHGGNIDFDEPIFLNDDLSQLCQLGLLSPDHNSKGDRLFRITRATVRYVAQLEKEL